MNSRKRKCVSKVLIPKGCLDISFEERKDRDARAKRSRPVYSSDSDKPIGKPMLSETVTSVSRHNLYDNLKFMWNFPVENQQMLYSPQVFGFGSTMVERTPDWLPLHGYPGVMLRYPFPQDVFPHWQTYSEQYKNPTNLTGSSTPILNQFQPWSSDNRMPSPPRNRNLMPVPVCQDITSDASVQLYAPTDIMSTPVNPGVNNSALIVKNIPPSQNKTKIIHEYFCKFGRIRKIRVEYENDLEAAWIEYENITDARAAYSCPEPVFNNRFIEVLWEDQVTSTTLDNYYCNVPHKPNLSLTYGNVPSLQQSQQFKSNSGLKKTQPLKKRLSTRNNSLSKISDAMISLRQKQLIFVENCKNLKEFIIGQQNKNTDPDKANFFKESLQKCECNIASFEEKGQLEVRKRFDKKLKGDILKGLLDTELDLYHVEDEDGNVADLLRQIQQLQDKLVQNNTQDLLNNRIEEVVDTSTGPECN